MTQPLMTRSVMTRFTVAAVRVALLACPRTFRSEYGDAVVRNVLDRRRHGHEPAWRIVCGEVFDTIASAITMRKESAMSRLVLAVIAVTVSVVAALAAGPVALAAVAVAAVAVYLGSAHRGASIDRVAHVRGAIPWFAAGAVAIAAAVAIPAVDGGELSAPWWSAMAALILIGVGAGVAGVSVVTRRTA
jgi:lysylphosphatidylglycerol synthetase-like protein (DUF2156 family)